MFYYENWESRHVFILAQEEVSPSSFSLVNQKQAARQQECLTAGLQPCSGRSLGPVHEPGTNQESYT